MIRYARASVITDAHPALVEAADFEAFARDVLAYRGRAKGQHYICGPMRANGAGVPHRVADCALPRAWLPFDFDAIADRETYTELRLWFARFRGFGYATASSTETAPRCRMVIELDREADRGECMRIGAAIARDVAEEFGDGVALDPSVFRPEQAIFTPLRDAPTFALDGDPVAVDRMLENAPAIEAERKGSAAIATDDDPVIVALKERGMYRRDLGAGRHAIRCPWESTHSSEDSETSTATVYLQPHHAGYVTPGFACKHHHCLDRNGDDLLEFLGIDWRTVKDAYSGRAKAPQGAGEVPPHVDEVPPREGAKERVEVSEWQTPADILRQISAPAFEFDDVPEPLARLARAWSDATGFDRSGIIVAGTVAAAAAIDDRYRLAVRPKSQWLESARLWGVLLAPPSGGKSPTLRAAADAIKHIHSELFHGWQRDCAGIKEDERPPKPALFTSDATVEALSDILRDNPRGVLMLTEEFASWIGSLDAYRSGHGSKDRGEWLQLYDGGPHQVDRVKRGSFLVPNWGASLLAAGTPDGLRRFLKDLPEDGLIHRFIPCVMGTPGADGNGDATAALAAWNTRLREIFQRSTCDATHVRARFAFDAQALFDTETAALRELVAALYDSAPALAAHLGKHAGMLARVALTFHWIDARPSDAIEVDTVRRAIQFMRRVRRHANALFSGILGAAPAFELARAIARALVADEERPVTVGRNWMTQHCRVFRVATGQDRRAAVELLEDAGWLSPFADRTYGGLPSAWSVDARVFDLFAAAGEKHRQRRAAVREAFAQ